ncbi:MAG: NADPH:quinone oxidoreductase family protein [Minwuia sp.]|nr:NADPH:quinone oxidoreductase family protein [Minwuia sp.]
MKVVRGSDLESVNSYRLTDVDPPRAGPGEVTVAVAACGIGYVDVLVALGGYQVKPPLPHVPGAEVAGTVTELGPGAEGLEVGQRVLAAVRGGFAEQVTAPVDAVYPIPGSMDLAAAAALPVNYLTALHGLRDRGNLQPGERLLVTGAAGGVGIAAVQVGKAMGAEVVAVASTEEKRAFASDCGADHVLDSDVEGWRERLRALLGGKGPNVIFDPLCGPLFEPAFRSLAWGGRHLVVGFVGGPIPALRSNLPLMKGAGLLGVDVRQFKLFEAGKAAAHMRELIAWTAEGRLSPALGKRFPFADFAAAMEHAHKGRGCGKTILDVVPAGTA